MYFKPQGEARIIPTLWIIHLGGKLQNTYLASQVESTKNDTITVFDRKVTSTAAANRRLSFTKLTFLTVRGFLKVCIETSEWTLTP